MTDIRADIDADAPPELVELGELLARERREPAPAFRHGLRAGLAGRAPRPRPPDLRRRVACWSLAAAALFAAGLLGAAGAGPFGI